MTPVSSGSFGLVIAYVLPGFVTLCGLSFFSPAVKSWLGTSPAVAPTVSGFLYVTLASIALGLFVSTVRWLVVNRLHHVTGIRPKKWDYRQLASKRRAMEYLVANQYRYYQFYGSMALAVPFAFFSYAWSKQRLEPAGVALLVAVETVLWLGARDTITKYYDRLEMLLGDRTELPEKPGTAR